MPSAHGRAADGQLHERLDRQTGPADRLLQLPGQAADLLPERKRHGVGQVGAADLEHVLPRAALAASTLPHCSRAGISRPRIAAATATWMAVGKTSLLLWPRLTWSLGWMGREGASFPSSALSASEPSPPEWRSRPPFLRH